MSSAKRELRIWPIVTGILAVGLVWLAASDFLRAWVHTRIRAEREQKVVETVSPALVDYRREQADLLGAYAWVDRDEGLVRIPVERAMELVAEEEGERQ